MTAAHAATEPAGTIAVVAAGSDTTEGFMTQLMQNGYNGGSATTPFFNIPANLPTGQTFSTPSDTDAADGCTDSTTWTRDPSAPAASTPATRGVAPFGSSAGRDYLSAENGGTGPNPNGANGGGTTPAGTDGGCINLARSSGAPSTTASGHDKIGFEFYAYAEDAVSWASTSLKAPATLTQAQLLGIYNCTITDWSTVGGTAGPIQRYFPQPGSGTRSFFSTDILGQASTYIPPTAATVNAAGGSCPSDAILIEENEGQQINLLDTDKAIFPYSSALWSFQEQNAINPTLDRRNGMLLKGITTGGPSPAPAGQIAQNGTPIQFNGSNNDYELDTAGTAAESNIKVNLTGTQITQYPGIRYLYNVLDSSAGGNAAGYAAAKSLFGFTNSSGGAKSPLCDNRNNSHAQAGLTKSLLQSNDLTPLSTTGNFTGADSPGGSNLAGSTCRYFKISS